MAKGSSSDLRVLSFAPVGLDPHNEGRDEFAKGLCRCDFAPCQSVIFSNNFRDAFELANSLETCERDIDIGGEEDETKI